MASFFGLKSLIKVRPSLDRKDVNFMYAILNLEIDSFPDKCADCFYMRTVSEWDWSKDYCSITDKDVVDLELDCDCPLVGFIPEEDANQVNSGSFLYGHFHRWDDPGKLIGIISNKRDYEIFKSSHYYVFPKSNIKTPLCEIDYTRYRSVKLGNLIKIPSSVTGFDTEYWMVVGLAISRFGITLMPTSNLFEHSLEFIPGLNDRRPIWNTSFNNISSEIDSKFKSIFGDSWTCYKLLWRHELFNGHLTGHHSCLPLFNHTSLKTLVAQGYFAKQPFWLMDASTHADYFQSVTADGDLCSRHYSDVIGIRPLLEIW